MSLDAIKILIWEIIEEKSISEKLGSGNNLRLKGLHGALKTLLISLLNERLDRPVIIVLPERDDAESLFDSLIPLRGADKVRFFPGGYEDRESPLIINPRRAGQQMRVVRDMLAGSVQIVVTTADGFIQRVPHPEKIKSQVVHLSPGGSFDLYELVEKLIAFGYTRESLVEGPGEISLRGGLLDIFPLTGEPPYRIDFFGDTIESLRIIDVSSQRSRDTGESLLLIPSPPAWEERPCTLLDYFDKDFLLFIEDPDLCRVHAEKEFQKGESFLLNPDELDTVFDSAQTLIHYTISSPKGIIDVGGRPAPQLGRRTDEIRENISSLCDKDRRVFLFCEKPDQQERINEFLGIVDDPIEGFSLATGLIRDGFEIPDKDQVVLSEFDIFKKRRKRSRRKIFPDGVPIRELTSLNQGDFVVHIDHGIGKYQGLETISVKGFERECLAILYTDGDKLYVPVEKMDRVQKYASKQGFQPVLNKLGSAKWEKLKSKTKQSIKNIAKDLITLYSQRQALPGFAFSPDTTWQNDLENSFLYEETPDQSRTIESVRNDMEKSRPMDRLICGDVGYGKTEIAIRAAFKAVNDGKQVAVMVPTTILAQQHLITFSDRLNQFPIQIEMLSRFRSRTAQKKIVEDLKTGIMDIIIGTHRLLSKDVSFKDLGLVILDEEQRFGVRHKEQLKTLRTTVDVLTLSATPIPRTLHLSLMGIRDMSVINTPPKDRLPIITEVIVFHESIIREAIESELERGGQIFFVHNRIRSIYAVARMIRRIVPGIRLAVAHGRMNEKELERTMVEFTEGKFDCLVSTMIIGSGLDMPRVNTLIVHRADQLGLAQLYQLRGRVGRSDRRAYAYLLTLPFHSLTPEAIKRLRTIEEFTELGSGFQIALRDLEIRGTGNLLGVQQSGHIDAVGFDLYTKLVEESVQEIRLSDKDPKGGSVLAVICQVDVDLTAYLPKEYVSDESQRVNLYRRLSSFQNHEQIEDLSSELLDRYGEIPQEAKTLLNIADLRIIGQIRGLKRIVLKKETLIIEFDEGWVDHFSSTELFSNYLRSIIDSSPAPVRFRQEKTFRLLVSIPEGDTLNFTKKWLQSWN